MATPRVDRRGESADLAPRATFHGRVAGVGLITVLVVLIAASMTFTLQQWAVGRAQADRGYKAMSEVLATASSNALVRRDYVEIQRSVATLGEQQGVVSARVVDSYGRTVAEFRRSSAAGRSRGATELRTPVMVGGQQAGTLLVTYADLTIAEMLPKFIALTFVLLFGGIGVALFLARAIASSVIAQVERISRALRRAAAAGEIEMLPDDGPDALFQGLAADVNRLLAQLAVNHPKFVAPEAEDPREHGWSNSSDEQSGTPVGSESGDLVPSQGGMAAAEFAPPQWGWPVLALVCPRDRLDAIAGDIEERYRRYALDRGKGFALWFYTTQIVLSAVSLIWNAVERVAGLAKTFKGG